MKYTTNKSKIFFLSLFVFFVSMANAVVAAPTQNAAIVVCNQDWQTNNFVVALTNVSAGVTAPVEGSSCAQAVSDLLNAGLEIKHVSDAPIGIPSPGLTYTFVSKK